MLIFYKMKQHNYLTSPGRVDGEGGENKSAFGLLEGYYDSIKY